MNVDIIKIGIAIYLTLALIGAVLMLIGAIMSEASDGLSRLHAIGRNLFDFSAIGLLFITMFAVLIVGFLVISA
jgi:hypothetical protein